jgi:hypothetical protein
MVRKYVLPLTLTAAAVCAFVPSAASAQWYGGSSIQFGYGSGYPYDGYGGYYDDDRRARWLAHERWEQRERWERERERHWNHERWEHRGWHHDDDDDD